MIEERAYKLCVFGESGVGKTTLVRRYLTGYFEENIKLTLGAEIFVKFLEIENIRVALQIWDFGGEKLFDFLLPLYARGASGGIFMFDLSREQTLTRAENWLESFREGLTFDIKRVPTLLVGGKLDLQTQKEIKNKEAKNIAREYNLFKYIECSSKTGKNVENVFDTLVTTILKTTNPDQ